MQAKTRWVSLISFILVVVSLLVACSSEPEATATPTKTPRPAEATPVVVPATALPTAVVLSTQPPSPSPSETPLPTATATATPEPEPPAGLIGPDSYPADVNPLTGEVMADPAALDRRPIAVKISNFPPQYVRPQAGLDKADLVFEHYAEGGVTRLTAVFYGQGASQVGSVRSGRLIDLEIPAMYQAAFAYSGSSAGVKQRIRNVDFFDRVISPDFGYGEPYFYRMPREGVPYEHTLFADLYDIWAWLDSKNNNNRPDLKGLAFGQTPPTGGAPASKVSVGYIAVDSQVTWVYDPISGRYLRWQGGQPHTELLTGAQLSAANVIVLSAHHQDTDILEDTFGGGHYSTEIQLWGEGPATLFRDGQRFEGRWLRVNRTDLLTFTDLAGNALPLKPGATWFQVVPLGFDKLTVEP